MMLRRFMPARPSFIIYRSMSATTGKKLSGKIAVVTASTEGIGFAVARRLAEDGAKVVVSSRRAGNVERAVAELQKDGLTDVIGVQCNVSKEKDRNNLIEETVKQLGGLDILVSNAAVNPAMGGVLDCAEPVWDKIFDVNVKSALLLSQLAVPHMRLRGGGAIVYVASIGGFHPINLVRSAITSKSTTDGRASQGIVRKLKLDSEAESTYLPSDYREIMLGAYSVSKTALLGLSKAVAQQVACDNIRANCIAPGIVRTRFSAPLHGNEAVYEHMLQTIPLGRIAEPHEMAGLVSFLVSDDASYITGENFIAAGGMPSRL